MPTLLTHAVIPVALAIGLGRKWVSVPLMIGGMCVAVLPDLDVIGAHFGVQAQDMWGHRGAAHSLFFGALVVSHLMLALRPPRWIICWLFLFAAIASHPLLDMLTDGAAGVLLYWPFDNHRMLAHFHPVMAAPASLSEFFSPVGLQVLKSEAQWIMLPAILAAFFAYTIRNLIEPNPAKLAQRERDRKMREIRKANEEAKIDLAAD